MGSHLLTGPLVLAALCLVICPGQAAAGEDSLKTSPWQPHRRLLGSLDPAAVRDAFGESGMDGEAGPFTDWVTVCQAGRPRCPSLFLASWGYQCSTWDGSACCLQPNGKFCMLLGPWANATAPAGWVGRNTTPVAEEEDERASSEDGTVAVSPAAAPALAPNATSGEPAAGAAPETVRPAGNSTAGEEAHKAPAAAAQAAEEKEQAVGEPARQDEQRPEREPEKDEPKRDLGRSDGRSSASSSSSAAKGSSRGNDWRRATATYFNSYPPCCTDSRADQRECREFSGCQWAGYFKGASGKKSKDWVRDHNIVAVFEVGGSKDWDRRWKGKTLKIKNPRNGHTMEVEVLDTCSDRDCGGCCTANARKNGGVLIDLEYWTARRFWGDNIAHLTAIEWQYD